MKIPGSPLARTPAPPYWAVIFTSTRTDEDDAGYAQTAEEMVALASEQPGYLGVESVRGADGVGITVSYWASLEAVRGWRENADHKTVQQLGREKWYRAYELRIARVERAYGFARKR
jgi:heme-degrading monooxygenase HmoA